MSNYCWTNDIIHIIYVLQLEIPFIVNCCISLYISWCCKSLPNCSNNYFQISTYMTYYARQLHGEELQGLGLDELMKLEKLVEGGISRVLKIKVLFT